ncbi:MAG TPA: DMT family transporter [Thermoanaerobaculia bacterium]|nr:DMT family transporter [Thermoanaerobaculia bacterium]
MKPGNPHLQIHFCVVLWGFTAVFGRLISFPALPLVWWRMMLVAAILAMLPRVHREVRRLPRKLLAAYAAIGMIIALHWLTFYGAIKVANASVGATCMALGPVFLAFIEPLIVKRRFDYRELLLGAAMIPGVILVVGGVPAGMRLGIAIGALSAFLVAIFGTLNKLLVHHADPLAVTAIELTSGAVLLTIVTAVMPGSGSSFVLPGPRDAIYLLILAVGCTIVPFTIALVALRQLTAFAAQLAVNLEPVYAILLAIFLLGEHRDLGPQFYAGVAIILTLVLAYPLVVRRAPAAAHPEELTAVSETRD